MRSDLREEKRGWLDECRRGKKGREKKENVGEEGNKEQRGRVRGGLGWWY